MANLGKIAAQVVACTLCRRIGCDQFGQLGFQRDQLVVQRIILGVGDDRRAEHIILIAVIVEQAAKLGGAFSGRHTHSDTTGTR
jgi:hypothetical protein